MKSFEGEVAAITAAGYGIGVPGARAGRRLPGPAAAAAAGAQRMRGGR